MEQGNGARQWSRKMEQGNGGNVKFSLKEIWVLRKTLASKQGVFPREAGTKERKERSKERSLSYVAGRARRHPASLFSTYLLTKETSSHLHQSKLVQLAARGKSLLELWVTIFLPNWQQPLIFDRLISNFFCMSCKRMASAHVILKWIRQRLRVAVSRGEK